MVATRVGSAPAHPRLPVRARRALRGGVGILVVIAALQLAVTGGVLPSQWFPPVNEIFVALAGEAVQPGLWASVWATLRGWAVGLAVATAGAIPLGLLIGSLRPVFRALRVVIEFLRPIPSVALVPVGVLIFSSTLSMKAFLVAFASFWPLLFQTVYGVRDVDPVARDTARVYGLGAAAQFRRIVLPSAAPYIGTGLRVSAAIGLILAVTGELVVGAPGLGRAIIQAQVSAAVELMYALILVTGLLGLAINAVFRLGEARLLHWHVSQRPGSG